MLEGLFFKPIKYQKIRKQAIILTIIKRTTLVEISLTGDVIVMEQELQTSNADPRALLGQNGEELAVRYLMLNGYLILHRNFRCRIGEIDIIAKKDQVLTFIEVKTRNSLVAGNPAEAVTFTKQQKIRRVAQYYLLLEGLLDNMPVLSFDVIEIIKHENKLLRFKHYEHCF